MNFWLLKSEAEMYSIDDFRKEKIALWTEVRNYQARNLLRDSIQKGDQILFYHSSSTPSGVTGAGEVIETGLGDPTALDKNSEYFDPKATKENNPWRAIKVRFKEKFPQMITLEEIKKDKSLKGIVVAERGSRLSVQPVSKKHFELILAKGKSNAKK